MDKGMVIIGGITVVVVGAILGIALSSPQGKPEVGKEVTVMENSNHIKPGEAHEPYTSNPPTSGPHFTDPASWGIKTEELPDETLIHNLEHGGVWVSYQPDKVDTATIDKLTNLVKQYRSKVILEPRKANDHPIAVVSWGRIMTLDSYDEQQLKGFIDRNRNHGPEQVPDFP